MKIVVFRKRWLLRVMMVCALTLVALAYARVSIWSSPDGTQVFTQAGVKEKELPVYGVATDEKKLSISFDAAWGTEKTKEILDILDTYNVKTTFFLVGFWVDAHPDLVKEITNRGHEIGNHSDTHAHMNSITSAQIKKEVGDCSDKIEKITGVRPILFRPPYGEYNDTVIKTIRGEGLEVVQWSVDSIDWKDIMPDPMTKRVTESIKAGDIVLFHNNSKYIAEALPMILEKLQSDGYEVVPVSELVIKGEYTIDHAGVQHKK